MKEDILDKKTLLSLFIVLLISFYLVFIVVFPASADTGRPMGFIYSFVLLF